MKSKKSFSRLDYYLMFIDQFKDQFTLVLSLNLVLFFITNTLSHYSMEVYFFSQHRDIADQLSTQFSLKDFLEYLSYVFLGSFIIHLMTYKLNKIKIFRLNAFVLVLLTSYIWSIISVDSIIMLLKRFNLFFILAMIGQFILYVIVGNEFFQLFKKIIKEPKINHS